MTKRLMAPLALALLVLGCGPFDAGVQLGEPVPLLTGEPGCFLTWAEGPLTVDPEYGTAITNISGQAGRDTRPIRVMWPTGFTGRRVGSEVAVLDSAGSVVAVTGRTYKINGGFTQEAWRACHLEMPQPA